MITERRELQVAPPISALPAIEQDVAGVKRMMDALDALMEMLKPDVDYGIIPKTNKPTILQPGAEKLLGMLNCAADCQIIDKSEDWEKGFFAFTVKVAAVHRGSGIVYGEGIGTANTRENRYRNQDTFTLRNTVLQMATVRGLRACAKRTAMASGRFTMDMEDETHEAHASAPQCALIFKLLRSHVFADEEREKALMFIEENPTKEKATEFIERIKARIAQAKEVEKNAQASETAQEPSQTSAPSSDPGPDAQPATPPATTNTTQGVDDKGKKKERLTEEGAKKLIGNYADQFKVPIKDVIAYVGAEFGVTEFTELTTNQVPQVRRWIQENAPKKK